MNEIEDFSKLQFDRDQWGQLVMTGPHGMKHASIEPVRCFPLSDPNHAIALLDADGRELFNLPSLDVLSTSAREILQRELTEREFVPIIRSILSTSTPNPPCRWEVETDRGRTSFQLESDDDCRRLSPNGVLIADSNGMRYRIPDIALLDATSRRIVRSLV
jgi:Domain of unknown function (DUF1854)